MGEASVTRVDLLAGWSLSCVPPVSDYKSTYKVQNIQRNRVSAVIETTCKRVFTRISYDTSAKRNTRRMRARQPKGDCARKLSRLP